MTRALTGLFGRKTVGKAVESAQLLKQQYRAGRREGTDQGPPPPRRIGHRDLSD